MKLFKRARTRRLMEKCIDRFREENPEKYSKVKMLRDTYYEELIYSGHMGSTRDGSESDRQENIAQDKITKTAYIKLKEAVERCHFKYTVRDVLREAGDDEKLSLDILTYQEKGYSGTSVHIISDLDIGFQWKPADSLLKL